MAITALCVAAADFIAAHVLNHAYGILSETDLAAGIGFVNMFGSFGGFSARIIRVKAETMFANQSAGLQTLAAIALVGAILMPNHRKAQQPLTTAPEASH